MDESLTLDLSTYQKLKEILTHNQVNDLCAALRQAQEDSLNRGSEQQVIIVCKGGHPSFLNMMVGKRFTP